MLFDRRPLFGKIATEVLRLKQIKAEETRKAASRQIGRLIENFGAMPIGQITENAWVEYVQREMDRKPRKFFDDRKYMRMILLYAARKKLITDRPQLPIPDIDEPAGREISTAELQRLEEAAGPELRFQIRVGWKMGLRLREMMRLRWDQFNWEEGTIVFSAGKTKTRRSREVAIPPDLLRVFEARKALSESAFVFPSRDPSKSQEHNRTAWGRCKTKAEVRARWHDLRHTCATVMLRRGIPMHVARRYLGMSERVLSRIYLHLNRDDLRKAAKAMTG